MPRMTPSYDDAIFDDDIDAYIFDPTFDIDARTFVYTFDALDALLTRRVARGDAIHATRVG